MNKPTLTASTVFRVMQLLDACASLESRSQWHYMANRADRGRRASRARSRLELRLHGLLVDSLSDKERRDYLAILGASIAKANAA